MQPTPGDRPRRLDRVAGQVGIAEDDVGDARHRSVVITGAALIMIVIFASFILSPILIIKEVGFGLAAAVLVDATVVRVLLVPAVMRLLGSSAWWLPGWLRRILPTIQLEREIHPHVNA